MLPGSSWSEASPTSQTVRRLPHVPTRPCTELMAWTLSTSVATPIRLWGQQWAIYPRNQSHVQPRPLTTVLCELTGSSVPGAQPSFAPQDPSQTSVPSPGWWLHSSQLPPHPQQAPIELPAGGEGGRPDSSSQESDQDLGWGSWETAIREVGHWDSCWGWE